MALRWRRLAWLAKFAWPHRRSLALVALLILVNALLRLPVPFLSLYLVDTVIPLRQISALLWISGLIIGMSTLFILVDSVRGYVLMGVSRSISARLECDLLARVQKLPIGYLMAKDTGYIVSRFVNDITALNTLVSDTVLNGVQQLAILLVGLFAVFHINPRLGLASLTILPGFIALNICYGDKLRRNARLAQERRAEALEVLNEAIATVFTTKVFAREVSMLLRVFHKRVAVIRTELSTLIVSSTASALGALLASLGPLIVLCYGGYEIIHGRLTLGGLIAFNSVLAYLHGPTSTLTTLYLGTQNALAALDRVSEVVEMTPEGGTTYAPRLLRPATNIRGAISFDNVSFCYHESVPILHNVTFQIEEGRVTALVGENGSGKSSIVRLLFRLYTPATGHITLDGVNIARYDLKSLRQAIGLVSQDTVLLAGSVLENIRFSRPSASRADVFTAAQLAHAHSFISELPEGYDTLVGRMGFQLSAGQRQRIALARAILAQPKILVLDEATSSIDSQSEDLIWDAFDRFAPGRTTIIISHRLSSLDRADHVVHLSRGRIVDAGPRGDCVGQLRWKLLYAGQPTNINKEPL